MYDWMKYVLPVCCGGRSVGDGRYNRSQKYAVIFEGGYIVTGEWVFKNYVSFIEMKNTWGCYIVLINGYKDWY